MDTEYKEGLQENIWKLFLIQIGSGVMLATSIVVVFLQANGLSLQEVLLLQSVFAISIVALEIPSGYLSDRWGRKNTLIAGSFLGLFGYLIYALSSSFLGFACAEVLLALGVSCYSGTQDAITYDTLLELDQTKSYRKIIGQQFFAHFGAEAVGGILGGFMALSSLRLPFWASLIPFGIACCASLTLQEPRRHKLQETRHLKAIWDICAHTLVKKRALRSVVILHSLIAAITLMMFWLTQPYQMMIDLPLAFYGVTHAFMVGSGAYASKVVHTFEKKVDDRLLLVLIAIVVIASTAFISRISAIWGLLFFLCGRTAWGFLSPLTSELINRMTTSDIRATTLSIRAMGNRLLFALVSPLLGYAADLYGLSTAFLLMSVIGGASIALTFLLMRPIWKEIPK